MAFRAKDFERFAQASAKRSVRIVPKETTIHRMNFVGTRRAILTPI
jgi:hypothetical protein